MFRAIPALVFALFASPALAQFQPTDSKLLIDWPELEQNYTPGSEFSVYAIVSDSGSNVIYVVTRSWRGQNIPFGAFECNRSFTYLDRFTNGFRNIRCVTTDGVGNEITKTLRVTNNSGYVAVRP